MTLSEFLTTLAQDGERLDKFNRSPADAQEVVNAEADLSQANRDLILGADVNAIFEALKAEAEAAQPANQLPADPASPTLILFASGNRMLSVR